MQVRSCLSSACWPGVSTWPRRSKREEVLLSFLLLSCPFLSLRGAVAEQQQQQQQQAL